MENNLIHTIAGQRFVAIKCTVLDKKTDKKLTYLFKKYRGVVTSIEVLDLGFLSGNGADIHVLIPESEIFKFNAEYILEEQNYNDLNSCYELKTSYNENGYFLTVHVAGKGFIELNLSKDAIENLHQSTGNYLLKQPHYQYNNESK